LVELHVKSSLTGPAPVAISFNDGFNAIIGGRASRKSAFLEYLRFGLGRTDRDLGTLNESANDREARLIDETLSGDGIVEVVLEREGVRETWTRTVANQQMIVVFSDDGMRPKKFRNSLVDLVQFVILGVPLCGANEWSLCATSGHSRTASFRPEAALAP
jgi:hypothetical protein